MIFCDLRVAARGTEGELGKSKGKSRKANVSLLGQDKLSSKSYYKETDFGRMSLSITDNYSFIIDI